MPKNGSDGGSVTVNRRPATAWLFCVLPVLGIGITALLASPASAGQRLAPVRFWAAGKIIPLETPAVWTRGETYIPLEALHAIGASGTLSTRRGDVTVRLSGGRIDSLRYVTINGLPMLRLLELAESTNGVVIEPKSYPARGLQPHTAYLLARITGIRLGPTALTINTTFPVPFVSNEITGRSSRGYVDCIGATGEGFRPYMLPADERRAERIRIAQFAPDISRVAVDFTSGFSLERINTRGKVTAKFVAPLADQRYAGGPGSSGNGRNGDGEGDGDDGPGPAPTRPPDNSPSGPTPAHRPRGATEILSIKAEPLDNQSIRILIDTNRKAQAYATYSKGSRQLVVDIPNSRLNLDDERQKEREIQHPLVEYLSAETVPGSTRVPPLTRITLDAPRFVETTVRTRTNQIILEISAPESGPTGTSKPISNSNNSNNSNIVVVDAGHGGALTGAKGRVGGRMIYEKDIALAIASKLRAALEAHGSRVVMTRLRDVNVPLEDRSRLANEVGADVYISIHNDSSGQANTYTGTTTYYHNNSAEGRRLARCVEQQLAGVSGMRDRGAMPDTSMYPVGFWVLRDTSMPAVLCEVGFLNSSKDRSKLANPAFQQRVADAVCKGIRNYVSGGQTSVRPHGKKQLPAA
jgi:N-acetylmuramoyl-L-alanine amidase